MSTFVLLFVVITVVEVLIAFASGPLLGLGVGQVLAVLAAVNAGALAVFVIARQLNRMVRLRSPARSEASPPSYAPLTAGLDLRPVSGATAGPISPSTPEHAPSPIRRPPGAPVALVLVAEILRRFARIRIGGFAAAGILALVAAPALVLFVQGETAGAMIYIAALGLGATGILGWRLLVVRRTERGGQPVSPAPLWYASFTDAVLAVAAVAVLSLLSFLVGLGIEALFRLEDDSFAGSWISSAVFVFVGLNVLLSGLVARMGHHGIIPEKALAAAAVRPRGRWMLLLFALLFAVAFVVSLFTDRLPPGV